MCTIIYHIDKKKLLTPGQLIYQKVEISPFFGKPIISHLRMHGLPMPDGKTPESLDNPIISKLHPFALREYLTEIARHRVGGISYSRMNVFFAAESLARAQEIGRRMTLASGLDIYKASVQGDVFHHDMSWLDHDLSNIPYEERVIWFCKYWRNEADHSRRSQPPLAELLVQGEITIGEKVGETCATD